jgi:uncharacterized RDD family membrane protein YckC
MSTIENTALQGTGRSICIYFLAAPEDQDQCKAIAKYLSPIIRSSQVPIELCNEYDIAGGEDMEKFKLKLYGADIVLAFISADFISNDEIYLRTKKVMARYNNNETLLLPILIRNCLWKSTPFVDLPLLPKNFQPLNNKQFWNSEDDALTMVAKDISEAIYKFSNEGMAVDQQGNELLKNSEAVTDLELPESELKISRTSSPAHETGGETVSKNNASTVPRSNTAQPLNIDWRNKYYKNVLWKRAAAFFLDNLITMIPVLLMAFIIISVILFGGGDKVMDNAAQEANNGKQGLLIIVFSFAAYVIVCAAMESSSWRGTFGKLIMKLQITDREGKPISFFRALWRNIIRLLIGYSYLLIFPLLLQVLFFQKNKKLFHDQLSNTVIGEKLSKGQAQQSLPNN